MKCWSGIALCAAALLCAAPVVAREREPHPDIAEAVLLTKLGMGGRPDEA